MPCPRSPLVLVKEIILKKKKKKDSQKGGAWNLGEKKKKIKNSAAVKCEGIQKYIIW